MRQVGAVLALLAVGLVLVAACGSGETLLGERDSAADGDADAAEDVGDATPDASAMCGNNVVEPGEECDPAWRSDTMPDTCRMDCTNPRCGDGVIDTGEWCDDGNTTPLDGCEADCLSPVCGDGVVESGEDCDEGPDNSDEPDAACRTNCRLSGCGDGVIDTDEDCDLLNLDGETCVSLAHEAGGTLRCNATCHYDESFCRNPECGNGTCELGETATGCPADCTDGCGDGTCAEAEDQFGCPADCGAVGIAAGGSHSCVWLSDGTARCWGENLYGELGDGSTVGSLRPVKVWSLTRAVAVVIADATSCALISDGGVMCWGSAYGGLLGDGIDAFVGHVGPCGPTMPCVLVPGAVAELTTGIAISSGPSGEPVSSVCVALADGSVTCWGHGYDHVPQTVPGLTDVVAVATGGEMSYALRANGAVSCWGICACGDPLGPPCGDEFLGAVAVAAGSTRQDHCSVAVDGTATCSGGTWGITATISGVTAVSVGMTHRCAVMTDGTARCWGVNGAGELGDGTNTESSTPVPVADLVGAVAIAVGGGFFGGHVWVDAGHTCAVLSDGTAWCWGANSYGQLGNGATADSNVPVQVAAW
jgi:cysteine-rich repeat protein